MIRYCGLLCLYIAFYLTAMLLAPVLPLFAEKRLGPANNSGAQAIEPRLPTWLAWFDTSMDNSLWGDEGWRVKHCPQHWDTYLGMVLWLWRNPAAGFCWSVLSHPLDRYDYFDVSHSGNGLDVDKGAGRYGWYFIQSRSGAFSYRWCKKVGTKVLSFEAGWLLDIYVKNPAERERTPRAPFQFQPQIKTAKV